MRSTLPRTPAAWRSWRRLHTSSRAPRRRSVQPALAPPRTRWSRRARPATAHAAATCWVRLRCKCATHFWKLRGPADRRVLVKRGKRRTCIHSAQSARSAAVKAQASLDELVAVELLDRRLALDQAFGEIEVLQRAQALDIDLAELLLARIDQRRVILQRGFDRAFLALPLRHEAHEI